MTLIFWPGFNFNKLTAVDFFAGFGIISTAALALALGVGLLDVLGVTGTLFCVVERSEIVTFNF